MEHEQMFIEALKFLARKYSIEVKERELSNEEKEAQSARESMFIVNGFARLFSEHTENHIDGRSIGMAYFRQRGFRDDTIEKFQLGFSLEQHDALAQEAMRKGYQKEFLVKRVCATKPTGKGARPLLGTCDVPCALALGKVVAFGGRVMSTENKSWPST